MDLSKVPLNEYGHVQTRGGRPARIICNNRKGIGEFVALVDCGDYEQEQTHIANGNYYVNGECASDLVPVTRKVRVHGWLNMYRDYTGYHLHESRADADNKAATVGSPRIACIEIDREVTEGEGL